MSFALIETKTGFAFGVGDLPIGCTGVPVIFVVAATRVVEERCCSRYENTLSIHADVIEFTTCAESVSLQNGTGDVSRENAPLKVGLRARAVVDLDDRIVEARANVAVAVADPAVVHDLPTE